VKRLLTLFLLTAGPSAAQDVVFSPAATLSCLSATPAENRETCIGLAAQRCIEATPGGYSTVGMSACLGAELDWWDARLNAAYRSVMAEARAMDAEAPDYAPKQAEALRDMQRAWIPFRDAKCAYERSQWGGGTGGGPATLGCLLHETAEQTLHLENSRLGG
jgi:uncharacterized protein YecT (DUF1311 family)